MTKPKLTKHEDDIRRGLRSPNSIPPYGKLRKKAEINHPQSPHDGIHTCSKGCKKLGCTRTLRDTIEELKSEVEKYKFTLEEERQIFRQDWAGLRLEKDKIQRALERAEDMCEKHAQEARTLYDFMSRFDWILYAHNCKGGASETHAKLDALRADYLAWKNPGEERGL